jgi:hypothetical protein
MQKPATPHEFVVKNFKTESGAVLPEARLALPIPAGAVLLP